MLVGRPSAVGFLVKDQDGWEFSGFLSALQMVVGCKQAQGGQWGF